MLRRHHRSLRSLLFLVDAGLCLGLFLWGFVASWYVLPTGLGTLVMAIGAGFTLPIALRVLEGEQTRFDSPMDSIRNLALGAGSAAVFLAGLAYMTGVPIAPSRLVAILAGQLAAVGLLRLSILAALRVLRRRGRNYRNIVVIGSGPRARDFKETLDRHPEWGLRLVGYVDEGDAPLDPELGTDRVCKLVDIPDLLRDHVIDEVITACPRSMLAQLGPVVEACSAAGVPVTVMNDLFGDYLPPPKTRRFGSHGALTFAPVHHNPIMLSVKRGIDIVGAVAGLLISAPVLIGGALAVRLTSSGPVFFRQVRCGLHGRPFVMYKLRTMVCDAEQRQQELQHLNEMGGPVFKIRHDPRLTTAGRYLRKFSIDELPQFWNVLVGDMSLVGPRPPIPAEVAQYKTWERRRLSMRPGLTCLWQVSGRNALDFDEWVRLDLQYIDSWSVTYDLKLLALTVPAVVKGTGE